MNTLHEYSKHSVPTLRRLGLARGAQMLNYWVGKLSGCDLKHEDLLSLTALTCNLQQAFPNRGFYRANKLLATSLASEFLVNPKFTLTYVANNPLVATDAIPQTLDQKVHTMNISIRAMHTQGQEEIGRKIMAMLANFPKLPTELPSEDQISSLSIMLERAKKAFPDAKFLRADRYVSQYVKLAAIAQAEDTAIIAPKPKTTRKVVAVIADATDTTEVAPTVALSKEEKAVHTFFTRALSAQTRLARRLEKNDEKHIQSVVRQYDAGTLALSYQPLVDGLSVKLLYKRYKLVAASTLLGVATKLDISLPMFNGLHSLNKDATFLGTRPADLVVHGIFTKMGYTSNSAETLVSSALEGGEAKGVAFIAYKAFRQDATPLGSKCYAEHTGDYTANGEVNATFATVQAYIANLGFITTVSSPYSRTLKLAPSSFVYAGMVRRIKSAIRQTEFVLSQKGALAKRKALVVESGKAKDYIAFPYPVIGYVISLTDMRVRDSVRVQDFQVFGE